MYRDGGPSAQPLCPVLGGRSGAARSGRCDRLRTAACRPEGAPAAWLSAAAEQRRPQTDAVRRQFAAGQQRDDPEQDRDCEERRRIEEERLRERDDGEETGRNGREEPERG